MRVLWLTNTPAGASQILKFNFRGGGWLSSMEQAFKRTEGVELAVCFFYNDEERFKFHHDLVTYYPIKNRYSTLKGKLSSKLFNSLPDSNPEALQKVIEDFKPDIIQLFGTESGLGEVFNLTRVPIILYIQGIINPYVYAWFPKGVSQQNLFFKSSIKDILLKKGTLGYYYVFKKMALREKKVMRQARYFFGRTDWDRRTIKLYNNDCEYFHCDDTLRPVFFTKRWSYSASGKLRLLSTINPNIYKGIEIVLEAAELLRLHSKIEFEWNIVGIKHDSQLVQLAEKLKGKKFRDNSVFFIGEKDEEQLADELMKTHLFIHPSHIDNAPNSVQEAMLMGLPVIAGSVGGVPSIIEHNVDGILYNSHDPVDLAGIILEKNERWPELVKLGDKARERGLIRNNPAHISSVILETYKKILFENGKDI